MSLYSDATDRAMAGFDEWLCRDPRAEVEPEDWCDADEAEVQHLLADAAAEDRDAFDADITAAVGALDLTAAFDLLDADADALAEIVLGALSRRPGPGPVRCGPVFEADLYDVDAPWSAQAVGL